MATQADQRELFLPKDRFQSLLDVLTADGFEVVGPTIHQGAIVYDEIESVDQLPRGWTDLQQPGQYRLQRRDDEAYFGHAVGPDSWKRYFFPPLATVATANRTENGWQHATVDEPPPRRALLGVRACELAAIAVQDRVFLRGPFVDPIYQQRRKAVFIVAVNCTLAAETCFCTSMGSGPRCHTGFDLALTEIEGGFIVEIGSDEGLAVASRLSLDAASLHNLVRGETARRQAVDGMKKELDTDHIRDLLLQNLEHPQWSDVASRCLSCTNCTMVCPTCFCSSVKEVSDLSGEHIERQREWDSCFNLEFSYMHGGVIRNNIRSRYRQWLTHKLASWHDQFDTSGCVGCGRCITWCPVGIDLTEEVAAIRKTPAKSANQPELAS